MATPYSTTAELRANVSICDSDNISDATVENRITQADKKVQTDLSSKIDFSAIVVNPDFINQLSQYKTAELCLVYLYGKKRKVDENSDIDYWIQEYNDLLEDVKTEKVPLEDGSDPAVDIGKSTSTVTNAARSGIEPALGQGKWGDHMTNDELETARPLDD
jgi:hypothetical protein